MFGDFADLADVSPADAGKGTKRAACGQEREYLRAYETVPAQLLNVYGASSFVQYDDETVWKHMAKPLKTGALFMTEYASSKDDRRGVALNRYLQVLVSFCKYQQRADIKKQNEKVIEGTMCQELYEEIIEMMPVFEILLAPKFAIVKEGAAALRTCVQVSQKSSDPDEQKLLAEGGKMYEWIRRARSRIRMLMKWQAAGGLSFVCAAHHRATQRFV